MKTQAWINGYNAYEEGKAKKENPFSNSQDRQDWLTGYLSAERNEIDYVILRKVGIRSTWTNGRPEGTGYFWVKNPDCVNFIIHVVYDDGLKFTLSGNDYVYSLDNATWIKSYQAVRPPVD